MRIGILDIYGPVSDFKDQGQIMEGLKDLGIDSFLIPLNVFDFGTHKNPSTVISGNLMDVNFWREVNADIILFFSRLNPQYTKILKIIKNSGKTVIIKADSDGTLGYPLTPNYLRTLKLSRNPVKCMLSNIKWKLPIDYFVKKKIEQIKLADAVIFESPEALSNVSFILHYWGEDSLIEKIYFVANPVAADVIDAPLVNKTDTIISVGRWEDDGCKNTKVMLSSAVDFLNFKKNYQYIIIGSGIDNILSFVQQLPFEISSRIIVSGSVSHEKIPELLSKSKIFFTPSNLESFGIAAAEALCMGCSIVGTPLESFRYLTASGFSGTITRGFQKIPIVSALIEDSIKWENGQYHYDEIANFWRKKLNRKEIAQEILKISVDMKNND